MFSIIIPMYNSAKTITKLIQSIIKQTYDRFEVLLIDDGSQDDTAKIIEDTIKDKRFNLIRQENKGVSAARNMGLRIAQGEYITFIDSDDYIEPTYLENLHYMFVNNKADIVFMEFMRKDEKDTVISVHNLPHDLKEDYYDQIVSLSECDMFGYTWIKALRRSVIGNVRFNESISLFEDESFTCEIMGKKRKIAYIYKPLYNYIKYQGEQNLTSKTYEDYPMFCENVYVGWKKILVDKKYKKFLEEKANHLTQNCRWYLFDKNIDINNFCQKIRQCEFFIDSTRDDKVIQLLKKGNCKQVKILCILYRMKNKLKNFKGIYEKI